MEKNKTWKKITEFVGASGESAQLIQFQFQLRQFQLKLK